MPIQSRPSLLLTRPAAQSARFASQIENRFGSGVRMVTSPLLDIRFLSPAVPPGRFPVIVFTSEAGVAGFARMSDKRGSRAWCVGPRTAQVARAKGFDALDGGGDAQVLIGRIIASGDAGPILVVRGDVQATDIAGRLRMAGADACDLTVYAQLPVPLNHEASAMLRGDGVVVTPLFSPRTASLLAAEGAVLGRNAALWVVALSDNVAEAAHAMRPENCLTATRPDAEAMLDAIAEMVGTDRQP
jgi:uroporphyrinogen-III synthase